MADMLDKHLNRVKTYVEQQAQNLNKELILRNNTCSDTLKWHDETQERSDMARSQRFDKELVTVET
jgi:hypothetical protein